MELLIGLGLLLFFLYAATQGSDRSSRPQRKSTDSASVPRSQKAPKPLRAAEPAAPQKPKDHHRTHAAADDFGRPRIHPITPAARGSKLSGRVWVIDGDTICIGRTKIRLAGIDAPEIDMPFGQKSKWAMVDLCKGQRVTVVMHGETSYDRQVGTAYLPDGRDIGAEIIKRGLALDLAVFSGGKYREFEPKGARHRLAGGRFGHRSLYGKHS